MVCTGMAWADLWISGDFSCFSHIEFSPKRAVAQHFLSKVATAGDGNAPALVLKFTFRQPNGLDQLIDLTPDYGKVASYHTIAEHKPMDSVTFQFFGINQDARSTANVFFFD